MINRTLGAPLGGTICGGQYGLESLALRLMTPPNFEAGFGMYFPSIVVVLLGEPGAGLVGCWSPWAASVALGSTIASSWPRVSFSAQHATVTDLGAFVALAVAKRSGARAFALCDSSSFPDAAA